MERPVLALDPRRVMMRLFLVLFALLIFQNVINYGHLVLHKSFQAFTMVFEMDRECSVPTFFNGCLFLITALLFFISSRYETGKARRPWVFMSLITAFLGVDECTEIHERFMVYTLKLMSGDDGLQVGTYGWLFFAWIIPYVIAGSILLITLTPWLLKLPASVRNGLLLAGCVYVLGAVGVEAYTGRLIEPDAINPPPASEYPWIPCEIYTSETCFWYNDWRYVMLYMLEETLEMTGVILCIGALLRALRDRKSELAVRFS